MRELIAIIEDEPDILKLVAHHLTKANFIVREFQNAGDFFVFLEDSKPDLIVLDLMLPDADGFDVCKNLKGDDKLSNHNTIPYFRIHVLRLLNNKFPHDQCGLKPVAD